MNLREESEGRNIAYLFKDISEERKKRHMIIARGEGRVY